MRPILVQMLTAVKTYPISGHKIFAHHFRLIVLLITTDSLLLFEMEVIYFSRAPDHIMVSNACWNEIHCHNIRWLVFQNYINDSFCSSRLLNHLLEAKRSVLSCFRKFTLRSRRKIVS